MRMERLGSSHAARGLSQRLTGIENDDVRRLPLDDLEKVPRPRGRFDLELASCEQEAGDAKKPTVARGDEDAKPSEHAYVVEVDAGILHSDLPG